jgi:hypothetical protein
MLTASEVTAPKVSRKKITALMIKSGWRNW